MPKDENLIINIDEYLNVILKSETFGNYQVLRVNHFDGWAPYLELYNLDDEEVKIYENITKKYKGGPKMPKDEIIGYWHYIGDGACYTDDPKECNLPEDRTWCLWLLKNGNLNIGRFKMDGINHLFPSDLPCALDECVAWVDLNIIKELLSTKEVIENDRSHLCNKTIG